MDILKPDTMRMYLKNMTTSRGRTLSLLAKQQEFVAAMNSPLGTMLLQGLIEKHEELLDKISNAKQEASLAERVEYNLVMDLLTKWSTKIEEYYRTAAQIEKEVMKDVAKQ